MYAMFNERWKVMRNNKYRRACLVSALPVLAAFFLCACAEKEPPREAPVLPVKMVTYGGDAGEAYNTYPGITEADRTADLAYENPGRLIELPVNRGQEVKKGDLLAKLDPLNFESRVAAAKATFAEARADLERYRTLYEKDAVARADLEVKQVQFDVAKAELAIAEKSLRDTDLRAPYDGLIARKFVENFQDVKAKEPIVRVQDISKIEVIINVPETDVIRSPGRKENKPPKELTAYATFESRPGRKFPLGLKEFESQADPQTQAFLVKFVMANPDDVNVLPGMTARVSIKSPDFRTEGGEGGVVPVGAIFPDDAGKNYVWVVDPESMTVSRREVGAGSPTGDSVRILSGLENGESVVTTGVHRVQEGGKVRPYERLMEPSRK